MAPRCSGVAPKCVFFFFSQIMSKRTLKNIFRKNTILKISNIVKINFDVQNAINGLQESNVHLLNKCNAYDKLEIQCKELTEKNNHLEKLLHEWVTYFVVLVLVNAYIVIVSILL